MTASVSSAWMDRRVGVFGSSSSRTQSLYSGRVVICQPPATSTSCSPRPSRAYSARRSSRAACQRSRSTPASTFPTSRGVIGWGEAKISASRMARTSSAGSEGGSPSRVAASASRAEGWPSIGAASVVSSFSSIVSLPRGGRRGRLRTHGPEHTDRPERAALIDLDRLEPDQLEQGQEGHDHVPLGGLAREQLQEVDRLALAQEGQQLLHALFDALALPLHLVGEQWLAAIQQLLEGADQ